MTTKCLNWLNENPKGSPRLVLDLEEIKNNYKRFINSFVNIKPYYAVKANPNKKIISLLNNLGCYFDCASIKEIETCLKLNVNSNRISFGNTIKKEIDIKKAFSLGVNMYAFDCIEELKKISKSARGAQVYCRIQVPNGGAEWPLSKKFGCSPTLSQNLLIIAKELKLDPIGISFHVGSQQMSTKTWDKAISMASEIYKKMNKTGIKFDFLNLGGGIPANYKNCNDNILRYSKCIKNSIKKYFKEEIPKNLILEPGRFLVASAGIIEAEIILISDRNKKLNKWIYIDVGRYNGLAETEGEAIKYIIEAKGYNKYKTNNFVLAGPSCDSHDILYEKNLYKLPSNLKIGDRLRIFSAGAYTISYQSNFNGIKKLKEIILE